MSLFSIFLLAKGKKALLLDRNHMEWAIVSPGEGQALPCDRCKQLMPSVAYFRTIKKPYRVFCHPCYVLEFEYNHTLPGNPGKTGETHA